MNKRLLIIFVCICATLFLFYPHLTTSAYSVDYIRISIPHVGLEKVPVDISIKINRPLQNDDMAKLFISSNIQKMVEYEGIFKTGGTKIVFHNVVFKKAGQNKITILINSQKIVKTIEIIPGIVAILPSLVAILFAFITRQVILSLLFGVWMGAFFIYDYNPITAFFKMADTIMVDALSDPSHIMILVFSLMLGGMVGIISRAGGTYGIVNLVSKIAKTPRSAQLASWLMGVIIFFDDYSNTLLVGNTMRPFTDKLKVSREKLSYIVDSTAAPVTSIAVITTWIGTEIGLINDLKLPGVDGFKTFIASVPYSFYSILAIIMVFIIAITRRDFGPMLQAEKRARSTGKVIANNAVPLVDTELTDLAPRNDIKHRWYNAFIPIITVIGVIIAGLYIDGCHVLGSACQNASLRDIFGAANSLKVLMWGSFSGVFVAGVLVLGQRLLTIKETMDAWLSGLKSMIIAALILTLAWSLTSICAELNTAAYVAYVTKSFLSVHLLPVITFIVAAFIGFATGTSWGTMGILVPIILPLAIRLTGESLLPGYLTQSIFISTVGAILSGSVFGDHCSPISDTTIMSSMASGSDHIDHVRTQLPYALLVAGAACILGFIPAGYGVPAMISNIAAILVLFLFVTLVGKHPDPYLSKKITYIKKQHTT